MVNDLIVNESMTPAVAMLHGAVTINFNRLKEITHNMSQEEVDYKGPAHTYNSTAQLIKHLIYVDLNWVYRIKGEALPEHLKQQYGPMIDENGKLPSISGIPLGTLLANYEAILNQLDEICLALEDSDLSKVVMFGYENEKQATIRWGIWHIANHSRYHQAHINQLRRMYKEVNM